MFLSTDTLVHLVQGTKTGTNSKKGCLIPVISVTYPLKRSDVYLEMKMKELQE